MMGVKHVRQIENVMRRHRRVYSRTELRDELQTNYYIVLESLAYLLSEGKIEKAEGGFKWKTQKK